MRARKEAVIMERNGNHAGAVAARAIAATPEVLKFLSDQVYPNTLGIFTNQRSPIKNLFQIFMQTAPEVGYRYAFNTMVKSLAYAVSHPATAEAWLKKRKLHGETWESFSDASMLNQDAPAIVRKFLSANHSANNLLMKPFSKSEMILRFAAAQLGHKTGTDLADALGKSNALEFKHISALKVMDNMLDADRREVESILRKIINTEDTAGRAELVEQLNNNIAQQLIQKTIFDYNKANASIIARHLPAQLLVFTKFPTIVASDIIHKIETKSGGELAGALVRGYLAPYVIAGIVDRIGEDNLGDDNAIDLILGSGGAQGVTSLGALSGLQGFGNPVIAAPFKAVKGAVLTANALSSGDTEGAEKAMAAAGKDMAGAASVYGPAFASSAIRGFYKFHTSGD
jgi:hypothetical protein